MEKVDTFYLPVLPIEFSFFEIGHDVGTQLRLEFQIIFASTIWEAKGNKISSIYKDKDSMWSEIKN